MRKASLFYSLKSTQKTITRIVKIILQTILNYLTSYSERIFQTTNHKVGMKEQLKFNLIIIADKLSILL